jgi:hypothetical protein
MSRRFLAVMAASILAATWPAALALAGDNRLIMHSEPGDWLGQGNSYDFRSVHGTFTSSSEARRGFYVRFLGSGNSWTINGNAGRWRWLVPGAYIPAIDYNNVTGDTIPVLEVSGNSRGCNTGIGCFDVRQVAYDAGGVVRKLHLFFEYHCDENAPALTGELRLDADTSVLIQAPLRTRARRGQALTFPISATAVTGTPAIAASSVPAGATVMDNGNGTANVSWTPAIDQQGDFVLGFSASDGIGHTAVAHTAVRVDGDTLLDVVSEAGDRAWAGKSCRLRQGDMGVSGSNSNGASFSFYPFNPTIGTRNFVIRPLRPGNYSLLRRWSNEAFAGGEFIASPAVAPCGAMETHFRIRRREQGRLTLQSMWVEWEQHCEGEAPAFRGEIRFNAGSPITVYAPIARRVHHGDTLRFGVMARDTLGRPITLSAWPLPAGASFTPSGAGRGEFLWTTSDTDNGPRAVNFAAINSAGQADTVVTDIVVTGDFSAHITSEPGDPVGKGASVHYDGQPGKFLTTSYVSDLFMGNIDAVNLFEASKQWTLRLRGEEYVLLKPGLYLNAPIGGLAPQLFFASLSTSAGARRSQITDFRLRRVERLGSSIPLRYWLEFESRSDDYMPILKGEIRQDIRWRVMARAPLRRAAVAGQALQFEVTSETPDGEVPEVSVITMPARGVFEPTVPGRGTFTWTADVTDIGTLRTVAFRATRQDGTSDTTWTALEALPIGSLHVDRDGVPLDLDTRLGQFRSSGGYGGNYITFTTPRADTVWKASVHGAGDTLRDGRYSISGYSWDPEFCVYTGNPFNDCNSDTGSFVLTNLERLPDYRITRLASWFSSVNFDGEFPVASSGWLFIGQPGGVDAGPQPPPPAEFQFVGMWPNPSSRVGRVQLSLPRAGTVTLALFDVVGRRVGGREWSELPAGMHALDVPRQEPLDAGMYFVEARYEGKRIVRRMVLLE